MNFVSRSYISLYCLEMLTNNLLIYAELHFNCTLFELLCQKIGQKKLRKKEKKGKKERKKRKERKSNKKKKKRKKGKRKKEKKERKGEKRRIEEMHKEQWRPTLKTTVKTISFKNNSIKTQKILLFGGLMCFVSEIFHLMRQKSSPPVRMTSGSEQDQMQE